MTAHDWQPGEVWLVSEGGDSPVPALADSHGWAICNIHRTERSGARWCASELVEPVRRLVLIDPEDRVQVERLRDLMDVAWEEQNSDHGYIDITPMKGQRGNALQAALRSLATPPKPDEPTGLGAVVEDADGAPWVRWCEPRGGVFTDDWRRGAAERRYAKYAEITAVRVLSEGVTP